MSEEDTAKKLPYFHRELSEHDQALMGKNVPKEIEATKQETDGKLVTASAWNAAGSWEERDATVKSLEKLKEILEASLESLSSVIGSSTSLFAIDDVTGNASVTHSRGKVRYMYEFSIVMKFESKVDGGTHEGRVRCLDLTNDQDEDEFTIEVEWVGGGGPTRAFKDPIRKKLCGGEFREALKKHMGSFESAFKAMFQ